MKDSAYIRVQLKNIPQEFIGDYNLEDHMRIGWVYYGVLCGCYGLPHVGKIAHELLSKIHQEAGYCKTATPTGLWLHCWCPIHFVLTVDDFGVEYMQKKDVNHLSKIPKTHHKISQDRKGKKFSGINLEWNYAPNHADRTCRLSTKNI